MNDSPSLPSAALPHSPGRQRFDAVIIGSGLGGSTAAAYLAAAGQRVLLLERYSVLGGSSHVFRRQGKWEFDCGVHYIGDCGPSGPVPTLLRGLALDDRINWLPLDPAGHDTTLAPGLELRTPHGWDAYLANLVEAFPEDARGLRRFVSVVRSLGESCDRSLTPTSSAEFAKAMKRAGAAATFAMAPYISLLIACGLKPRTILALSVQCGAMASTPLTIPTIVMANYFADFVGGGAWFPQGGGQMLSAGFAEVITSHGGQIRTNTGVEKILIEGGKVTGVRLDGGERIDAAAVVSGADIMRTYTDLVGLEHLPATYRQRVKHWRMARPLINGFFGVELDLSTTPNTNYFAIPSWDDATSLLALRRMVGEVTSGKGHTDGIAWAREFAARQPMFLQSSSQRDPANRQAAPVGHSVIEAQTLAPYNPRLWGFDDHDIASGGYRRDKTYLEVKKIITDGMFQRMEQAYPGSTSRIRLAELGSPASQERFVGNTGGSAYGLECRPSQSGPFRPGVRTPIPGLFLAGTSTAWGPGTEGSMLSGQHAAGAVLGRDLATEVREGAVIADPTRLRAWGADFDPLNASRGLGPTSTPLTDPS
ncbi:NAD(P)/FAD-dependent oxidoreductase [Nocardioides sp.]|uniref:phytoene desaturase family protein n=1 Tax=Nocardioides sp. TaxID=35761 RepID=UPI002BDAF644|nr:NAD(P)/FAD-dependent oxidoreductase [Nocardioides sp.]HSX65913.1 NAD(P)/FAD-dependent oxidoreductase [Nocardioides sp.]